MIRPNVPGRASSAESMENLKHLMAAYFHQDWREEYGGSWPAALEDFLRRAPDRC